MIYDVELDSPEVDVSNLLSAVSLVDISVGFVSTTSTAESNIISVLLLLMLLGNKYAELVFIKICGTPSCVIRSEIL